MMFLYAALMLLCVLACLMLAISLKLFDKIGVMLLVTVTVFLSAFLTYYHFGSAGLYHQYLVKEQHQKAIKQMMTQLKTPTNVIHRMQQQLQSRPNDSKGWYLLGRLYYTTRQFKKSAHAFSRANELKPNDIQIMLQLANARFFAMGQRLDLKARAALQSVLKQQAGEPQALNLLAMDAYFAKKFNKAIDYWQQAERTLPADSEDRAQIAAAIARARREANPNRPHILVSLDITKQARQSLAASTPIFIFAKAAKGSPMPLAVVKTTLEKLPSKIELSDDNAMSPNWHLSSVKDVYVMAKLSTNGDPLATKGAIEVKSAMIDLSQRQHAVKLILKTG